MNVKELLNKMQELDSIFTTTPLKVKPQRSKPNPEIRRIFVTFSKGQGNINLRETSHGFAN